MNKAFVPFLIVAGVIAALVLGGPFYIVTEGEQVVITRFGEPISGALTKAGLHFKTPYLDHVNRFDERILEWDGDPNQIPTKDKRFIWIDVTARWRIVDPLLFLKSVGNELGAQARLDDILDAATRDVITEQLLIEIVRNTNRELTSNTVDEGLSESRLTTLSTIEHGQAELMGEIEHRSKEIMPQYGIELVDVLLKRIIYVDEVLEKIYERMIAERKRAAEQFRSEGQGRKAEIEGRIQKDLNTIVSEAYRKSQEIKGKADGESTRIYAEAYSKDPDFYQFMKTLETYDKTIDNRSTLVLTTDSEYFRALKEV